MHMKIKCLFLLSPILAGVLSWGAQPTLAPLFLGGPAGIAGNGALGIFVNGPYAYVAAGTNGLVILDITDSQRPVKIGVYDTPGIATDVFIQGNLAFVADGSKGGLQIIDVQHPESPKFVASKLYNEVQGVLAAGHYVYLATGIGGLLVLDFNDPSHLVTTGVYDTPRNATSVKLFDNVLYVTDSFAGLFIFDMADPSRPAKIGQFAQELTLINPGWSKTAGFTVLVPVISGSYALEHRASFDAPWTERSSFGTALPGVRRVNELSANARPNGFYRMIRK